MSATEQPCFHCGLPVPPDGRYEVEIDGAPLEYEPMEIPFDSAVAQRNRLGTMIELETGQFSDQERVFTQKSEGFQHFLGKSDTIKAC